MGGDLAHAGQHFDVAVGEGADAGGECLQAPEASCPIPSCNRRRFVVRSAGSPGAPNALSSEATAFWTLEEGATNGGIGGGIVAVPEVGDLVEESVVAQSDQDLDLVADLGALWGGGAPG